jgi:uncharacterized membrane protein
MPPDAPTRESDTKPPMAGVLERNIEALLTRRREEERSRSLQERIADAVTQFAGSMFFVYLHLVVFGLWILINLGWTPLPEFDPTFVVLAMFASVEAIFLSTFVLITQNRMAEQADRRADLDLQVSLLAEHEVTRLVALVSAIAARMEIEAAHDPELAELKRDVHPETVMDEIELREERQKKEEKRP